MTRKASLLAAAAQLPATIEDVKEGMLLPGYVANITADAVFVRFLGGLTGRAGAPLYSYLTCKKQSRCADSLAMERLTGDLLISC